MKNATKGQISIELIVVVAVVLAIFIPILITVYFKGLEIGEGISIAQARLAVSRLASLSNSIGNLGEDASAQAIIFIPNNMESLEFKNAPGGAGAEIVIKLETSAGLNEISEPVKFKFAEEASFADLSQGMMELKLSSNGEKILIEK